MSGGHGREVETNSVALATKNYWFSLEMVDKQLQAVIAHLGIADPLTVGERAEVSEIIDKWAWVKEIRVHSDLLEADVDGGAEVDTTTGWPS